MLFSGTSVPLGQIVATPGALELPHAELGRALARHMACDWTDMDADDRSANQASLADGSRVFGAFALKSGAKIWIITDADRSTTTILLPEEC